MSKIHRYFRVLFLVVFALSLVPMNLLKIKISAETQDDYYLDSEVSSLTCSEVEEIKQGTRRITYADFYAKGDGVTNDYASIKATHDFANRIYSEEDILLTVFGIGLYGNNFYMSSYGTSLNPYCVDNSHSRVKGVEIDIATNVDWLGARFILDDYVDSNNDGINDVFYRNSVFTVTSKMAAYSRLINNNSWGNTSVDLDIESIKDSVVINENTESLSQLISLLKNSSSYSSIDYVKRSFDESKYWGVIINDNKKVYIRSGGSSTAGIGTEQQDLLVMDSSNGEFLDSPQWEYSDLKSISVFPINNEQITIKNGNFKTLTNNRTFECDLVSHKVDELLFTNRNLKTDFTGNVLIENITHSLDESAHENIGGWYPDSSQSIDGIDYTRLFKKANLYRGFISLTSCALIKIKNVELSAHTARPGSIVYATDGSVGVGGPFEGYQLKSLAGSYDFFSDLASYIFIDGMTYFHDPNKSDIDNYNCNMKDDTKWGIIATNLVRDLYIKNSVINRIDAHEGLFNLYVENSTIGNKGFALTGKGIFYANNVTVDGAENLITLRSDYGSTFDGNVILNNIKFIPKSGRCSDINEKNIVGFNQTDVKIKYDDCNPFAVVSGEFGSIGNLSEHTHKSGSINVIKSFDLLGGFFSAFMSNFDIPTDGTEYIPEISSSANSNYSDFYNRAIKIYKNYSQVSSFKDLANNLVKSKSAIVGINYPFTFTFGNDVDPAIINYQEVVGKLFSFNSKNQFMSCAQLLYNTYFDYNSNLQPSSTSLENGCFHTSNDLFIFPIAIKNNCSYDVLTYVIIDTNGLVSVWISDITAVLNSVNFNEDYYVDSNIENILYCKNSLFITGPSNQISIINSDNNEEYDYGSKSYFPNLYIDGLEVFLNENNEYFSLISLANVPNSLDKNDENINENTLYYFKGNVSFNNIKIISDYSDDFYLFNYGFFDNDKNILKDYYGGENKVNIYFDIINENDEKILPADLIENGEINYDILNREDGKFSVLIDELEYNTQTDIEYLNNLYDLSYNLYEYSNNEKNENQNNDNLNNKNVGIIVLAITFSFVVVLIGSCLIIYALDKKNRA